MCHRDWKLEVASKGQNFQATYSSICTDVQYMQPASFRWHVGDNSQLSASNLIFNDIQQ